MSKLNGFVDQYATALQEYLQGAGEPALKHAYELGRKAIADGLGGLELTKIHREALLRILHQSPGTNNTTETISSAYDFLAESLSSIEMTHRGFLDALTTLRASEERYRTLVDSARDVIYTMSPQGTITSLNPAFEKITGWQAEEWLGKSFAPLVNPDDLPLAIDMFQRVVRGETPPMFELRILAKSGEYIIAEFTKTPQVREGKVVGSLGIARDVSERKRAEEKIRQSQEMFRLISENAGDLIAVVDLNGRREYSSPSYGPILGDPVALHGTDSFHNIHPDDKERIRQIFFETIRTGVGQRAEYRLLAKDGTTRFIESQGNVIRDKHGRPLNVVIVSRDITERKKSDEQIKKNERRLARAEHIAHLGGWEWDVATNKVTWSEELYRIYGLKPDQFEGTFEGFLSHLHPEDREYVQKSIEEAYQTKQPFQFEERIVLPDGSVRTLESRGEVVLDEKGNPLKMFGSCLDITGWKMANAALNALAKRVIDAQEEERQRIARELHDDICQRLTGMKFIIDDFLSEIPKGSKKTERRIKLTKKEIDHLIIEVRRMSANLRPAALDDFGLTVALRRLCEEFQKLHKMKITFETSESKPDRYDSRVETALYRIVQEALMNAVKHAQATKIHVSLTDKGTAVQLAVRDNGKGIVKRAGGSQKDHVQRLGLVSMRERAQLLGGTFLLNSVPQKGTTIDVELPLPSHGL